MTRKRTDANHAEIIRALEKLGASVIDTSQLGDGFPDLIVGYRRRNWLLEVKDGTKAPSRLLLTVAQKAFFQTWNGALPEVVRSVDDVIHWSNLILERELKTNS